MAAHGTRPASRAAEDIRRRLGAAARDLYLGPEGDYLRLVRHELPRIDVSVSCCGLPAGRYSVQICLGGDPLDIVYDDECDLHELLDLCGRNFVPKAQDATGDRRDAGRPTTAPPTDRPAARRAAYS